MARKFLPSLAAAAFAAILFRLFSRGGDQARSTEESASGNDGTAGGASSTHTSTEGQEVATSSGFDYEVFLNFRGPDTRVAFTDILYTSLDDAGIRTFMDDKELHIGEEFGPEVLQAINQSKISVPIFSKGYASSVWCLKELVQMVKCWKNGRQKIMPIFYDVAPSVVQYQTGIYAKAFLSHAKKQRYGKDTIREWKAALNVVGEINGWDLHSKTNRREGEFESKVTQKVFTELKKAHLEVSECLVNVNNHVDAIMEMIGAGTSETRIIGIHGMGGIGKTTTAKMIYNKLVDDFDKCCFLQDIRETSKGNGIQYLQAQLISAILKMKRMDIKDIHEGTQMIKDMLSNKKVLLLLDDVEEVNHINALVGKRDWLGRGSKIIITTRKKDILEVHEVDCSYELKCMDPILSLKLFSKHAFRRDSPLDEYINQSNRAIDIAGGLPLALEVIGMLLSRIEKNKWDDKLKELEKIPPRDVLSKLKISYNALRVHEQRIFLDIACLFIGYEKDVMIYFWDESRFFPKEAMEVLENMSLMKIDDDNKVWMHNQVRDLGREIVRQESNYKIVEQSRVWNSKEALGLLRRQKKKKLEALRLPLDHQHCFAYEDFRRLPNLKFLEVCDSNETSRNESLSSVLPTDVFQENSDLLPELRWLAWPNIPPTFKIMNFSMKNVVILDLSKSRITNDWEGWSHMKVMKNLKVMDLSHCNYLKRTPDFSAHSKLERLIVKVCWGLVEIDKSISQLKSLVFLDLRYCRELRRLPNTIGDLESLIELDILDTGIKKLPDSIGKLKLLNKLNISRMGIEKLPHSIGNLESLIELDISYSKIKELPDSIGELKNLKVVKMDGCSTSNILDGLWRIKKLEAIKATVRHFNVKIGNDICKNRALRILELNEARIYEVPRLPEGLTILKLSNLYMNTFPDLSNLTNLEKLELKFARRDSDGEFDGPVEEDPMPLRIGNLSKLESLYLSSPYVTTLPTDISLLPQLKSLELWCPNLSKLESPYVTALPDISLLPQLKHILLRCPNLDCLPSLPSSLSSLQLESECVTALPTISLLPRPETLLLRCPNLLDLPSLPSSLCSLRLDDCKSCHSMGDLSNLKTLASLEIYECAISEIQGLDHLENLKTLELGKLQRVKILPDLRNLNKLWRLQVSDCGNLVEIQGELPSSLLALEILECGSLRKLPDLSSLKGLKSVEIKRYGKLDVEEISSLYSEEVEYEGDDSEFDNELEGEDDESGCESDYELEGED